jgi:hypothetical protein
VAVEPESVVIDAKSASRAQAQPEGELHAGIQNLSAYKVGCHQHEPEIEQLLGFPVYLVRICNDPPWADTTSTCVASQPAKPRRARATYATARPSTCPRRRSQL